MAAKVISISDDAGVTWYDLPGASGKLEFEGAQINDTIFGQNFESNDRGPIGWKVDGQAFYKGYVGYKAKILKPGATTVFTDEAFTLVSGKTYKITDSTKSVWDRSVAVVVKDNAVDHTADVESIDFLFGRVTFKAAYTPTTPITVSGNYFPMTTLGKVQEYKLTQTSAAIDTSDFGTLQSNGGYKTHNYGLQTVRLELTGFYDTTSGLRALLAAGTEVIIEINPDGNSKSRARGFFRAITQGQSGDVGALEQETISFSLNVPVQASGPVVEIPFKWLHENDTPIPTAVKKLLDAWTGTTKPTVRYLHDGTNGVKGTAVVVDVSLAGSLTSMNEFTSNFMGDGAHTIVGTG